MSVMDSISQLKTNLIDLFAETRQTEILDSLIAASFGFEQFLNERMYQSEEVLDIEFIALVVQLIAKACAKKSYNTEDGVEKLLGVIKSCKSFLLTDALMTLKELLVGNYDVDVVSCVRDYLFILRMVLQRFQLAEIVKIIPELKTAVNIIRNGQYKYVNGVIKEYIKLCQESEFYDTDLNYRDEEEALNINFISIVPRRNDILNCEDQDLPQNIIHGPYEDEDAYFLIHFVLMREDMIRTFRVCVQECITKKEESMKYMNARLQSGFMYNNIVISHIPEFTDRGIIYSVIVTCSSEINWLKTKHFIPGSLLCLTHDDFETVYFVSVTEFKSEFDTCRTCRLKVKIEDDLFKDELPPQQNYMLVEPSGFFECYRQILSAIKHVARSSECPLFDVIAKLEYDDLTPMYMKNITYCLHEKCGHEDMSQYDTHPCKKFNVLDYDSWPKQHELGLDEHQHKAFYMALTKKVALIQGPPGTGKTFLGVKIVRALLDNLSQGPIFISCLSNHALDQFLGHILKFTKKVVRLGSQTKDSGLHQYMLNNMDIAIKCEQRGDHDVSDVLHKAYDIAKLILGDISMVDSVDPNVRNLALRKLCKIINRDLSKLNWYKNKYLEDEVLMGFIPTEYHFQLINRMEGKFNNLRESVMEWLHCTEVTFYRECEKHFKNCVQEVGQDILNNVANVWKINDLSKRFEIFSCWRLKHINALNINIECHKTEYKNMMLLNETSVDRMKVALLRGADIIAATTTGAAKYKDMLRHAKPPIIIVEEAAQCFESHVLGMLFSNVKQLILIGDHQQLRPICSDNQLAEKHNLAISMFERLFKNKAPSCTLAKQHRMRPLIADLIVKEIYPDLLNDNSVSQYEDIKGVSSNLYFFDHNEPESENSTGTSSSNEYEAYFVANLAKYFLKVGYSSDQITILATYNAQLPLIRNHIGIECDVHVTSVDNYQGEENDIVIISFVRSNIHTIGFLKEENRVCVALSRARKGMYCFGNFCLYAPQSHLWNAIITNLEKEDLVGNRFPLQCIQHGMKSFANNPDDLLDYGGCNEICNTHLSCGHVCERLCHFDNADHKAVVCKKPCTRYIAGVGTCTRRCFQPCLKPKLPRMMLPCGHYARAESAMDAVCKKNITEQLKCGHHQTLLCGADFATVRCTALDTVTLPCGHDKKVACSMKDQITSIICQEQKSCIASCGHDVKIPCNLDPESKEVIDYCTTTCDTPLSCGHDCVGSCESCFHNEIHSPCTYKCKLKLPCGHNCTGFCGAPCSTCEKECFLKCPHGRQCLNKCTRPCTECNEPCLRTCPHGTCTKLCLHPCNIDACDKDCDMILECGHPCIGMCGDKCPILCRICHRDKLSSSNPDSDRYVLLDDCKHIIEVNEMNSHVQNCLEVYEWPDCPKCSVNITHSIRYNNELLEAKNFYLRYIDTSITMKKLWPLAFTLFNPRDAIPCLFKHINEEIDKLVHTTLTVSEFTAFKSCLCALHDLVSIHKKLDRIENIILRKRFDTLVLWIGKHLKRASYQQMFELNVAVKTLVKQVNPS